MAATKNGVGRGRGSSKPMNVEQIVAEAQNYDYNPQISLTRWLHSANALLREAEIYAHEGNDQRTYLYLFRHAQLVLGKLTQHPEVGAANRGALNRAEADVKAGLAKMEELKPRINRDYERFQRILREREARGTAVEPRHTESAPSNPGSWFESEPNEPQLSAGENRDLAVQVAKKEFRRRAAARKATLRAGIPEEVEQERRTAGVWGNWEKELARDPSAGVEGDSLSHRMQHLRMQVDGRAPASSGPSGRPSDPSLSQQSYKYPSVQPSKPLSSDRRADSSNISLPLQGTLPSSALSQPPPLPPPKDHLSRAVSPLPARPPKQSSTTTTALTPAAPPPPPVPDRPPRESSIDAHAEASEKLSAFSFKPSAFLESGTPLRTVFLPPDLRRRFISIAAPNTARNLETCGILCGTLIKNALFISRLVIPEQISTSDTCETINEGALFDYVDSEDLMMLGWIHTHPTQTCFMSSRDLHTHGGYQAMLAESIAIVCAPSKQPDWGIFRLTDPPGLQAILKCKQSGLFHPHDERNMYTDALRPGHVFEAKGMEWDVHDMRKD